VFSAQYNIHDHRSSIVDDFRKEKQSGAPQLTVAVLGGYDESADHVPLASLGYVAALPEVDG